MDFDGFSWLVGILEGEGSFFLSHTKSNNYTRATVKVVMTDLDIILRCKDVSGVGNVTGPYMFKGHNRKPVWTWQVTKKRDVFDLMIKAYPQMGHRRKDQIRKCLTARWGVS